MKIRFFILYFCFLNHHTYAQDWTNSGRNAALGNTALSDSSEWNLLQNPSCIAQKSKNNIFIGLTDRRLYNIQEYNSYHAVALFRFNQLHTGLTFQKEGYSQFKQTQVGIHMAHQINAYKLGASVYYKEFILGEIEKTSYFYFTLGGSIRINKELLFGCSIQNIALKNDTPLILASGLTYYLSNKVTAFIDFKNSIQSRFNLHIGLEYKLCAALHVLTGYNRLTNSFSIGTQVKIKSFECNYAFIWGSRFGNTHQLSCCIRWNSKK
jgi:hypothetical protein